MAKTPPQKIAYVIQSAGSNGRLGRAEHVYRSIIVPACGRTGYVPQREQDLPRGEVLKPIISPLYNAPLVVADLGKPPLKTHALIQVGFRLSTGRPTLFLAD